MKGCTPKAIRERIDYHLTHSIGISDRDPTDSECQIAVALASRDFAIGEMNTTNATHKSEGNKKVYYLSLEFLIGRLTHNNLMNMGIYSDFEKTTKEMGWNLTDVLETEPDPSLGNGGLGRLAACFLDSMATLGYAGYGYGINYEYGLFRQSIVNGHQKESPDGWLETHSPWQIERPERRVQVPYGGRIEHGMTQDGDYNPSWVDWNVLIGIPHDMPIVGYGQGRTNYLRLFSTHPSSEFDMDIFNDGDYVNAVRNKIETETISKVLYPSDSTDNGKKLRLMQEYFFVACALRDIVKDHLKQHDSLSNLPDEVAIQLNDTHPALAVAELMRLLADEQGYDWDDAWQLTQRTLAYTNHTLLPEALEKWPIRLVEEIIPRHCQIIYEINRRFLADVAHQYPGDVEKLRRMSIVEEGDEPKFRMANLSIIGSHSVNGVAAMHSELVKSNLVPDFYHYQPEKFNNKTNGITQRRWLQGCNPELSSAITDLIGDKWVTDLSELRRLTEFSEKESVQNKFHEIKRNNKERLAKEIFDRTRISVDIDSLFDIQIKRIHEYKRQLLNAMHIADLYFRVKEKGEVLDSPRTFVFSGKAAPSYTVAKVVIKFINSLASVINNDPVVSQQLKVVFFPDYRVSVAEKIIPAAELSEQISTAGFEASGTGNMKLSLNGALTVGTLDGANVEIREEVGPENIYIFGNTDEQVRALRDQGYSAHEFCLSNPDLSRIVGALETGELCPQEPRVFQPMLSSLFDGNDYFQVFPDFASYKAIQNEISRDYKDQTQWTRKSILNIAGCGKFSSDRTIREYAEDIWGIESTTTVSHRKAA